MQSLSLLCTHTHTYLCAIWDCAGLCRPWLEFGIKPLYLVLLQHGVYMVGERCLTGWVTLTLWEERWFLRLFWDHWETAQTRQDAKLPLSWTQAELFHFQVCQRDFCHQSGLSIRKLRKFKNCLFKRYYETPWVVLRVCVSGLACLEKGRVECAHPCVFTRTPSVFIWGDCFTAFTTIYWTAWF